MPPPYALKTQPGPPGLGLDWAARVLAVAAAYYATAQVGLLIPSVLMVSLFWPPVGVATALLFRLGLRHWPGVLLGAFGTNFHVGGAVPALGFAVGTTAACVLMARGFRRCRLNPAFESVRDLRALFGVAAAGCGVSAAGGVAWSAATGVLAWPQAGHALLVWWLGDVGGVVLGAPVVLAWSYPTVARLRRRGHLRGLATSFGLLLAVCGVLFGGVLPSGQWSTSASFLPLLLIAWTATVYRAWAAMAQVVILGAFVVWANYRLQGPCLYVDPAIRLYAAWAYLITAGVIALGLSGLLAERDAVERKLKTGEETYRALVHDNPALICRFSTDGTLLFANETFRRAFTLPAVGDTSRLTRTDLRKPPAGADHNFYVLAGLAADLAVLAQLRDIKQPDRPVLFESKVVLGAGETHWFRWTARAVDMASSVVTEYHAVGLDVTDQKQGEAKRQALEAQAVQTQQYEAIGVLAGGIAHEFNNILTGIVGNTDLSLMLLPEDSQVRPLLTDVMTGAQRAADLTKQLSLFAGRTGTNFGPVDLSEVVRMSEGFMSVVVPRRCPLRYDLAAGALAVADDAKVRQLLIAVVTNAAEAMADREAGGEIVVRTSVFSLGAESSARTWVNGDALAPGEYVQLEVTDAGCGMTSNTLAHVFEPFFTTKFPGRGLGMAAVLGIVQDHRGAIQVQSQKGKGTTVRVLFPAVATAVDRPTPVAVPRAGRRNVRLSEVIVAAPKRVV